MTRALVAGGSLLAVCATAFAQSSPPRTAKPDSVAIQQRIDALKKTAAADWGEAVDFICALDPNRANRPDDPEIEPTRVFDDLAVLTSPGAASRRGEVASTERALAALPATRRLEVARILPPGHLDGGDVLKVGRTAYVGLSGRTDEAAIAQLSAVLTPRGWQVVTVPVTKVLHLKSGVTALPDGTVVGFPPLVDDVGAYPTFLAVPEEHGTAVVDLGDADGRRTVLMSADAPRTAELYAARGLQVVTVPITEFEKLEGCVTCLSVRLRDAARM
jgi:dimethylargininase